MLCESSLSGRGKGRKVVNKFPLLRTGESVTSRLVSRSVPSPSPGGFGSRETTPAPFGAAPFFKGDSRRLT
jgi:hypothetical protein